MSEYVKRDAAIKVIQDYGKGAISDGMTALGPVDDIVALARAMERLDAADVAPVVHGRWVSNGIPDSILSGCSACGFSCGASSFRYCPNCGARMNGRDDHAAD